MTETPFTRDRIHAAILDRVADGLGAGAARLRESDRQRRDGAGGR
jgi:hypothetical protein